MARMSQRSIRESVAQMAMEAHWLMLEAYRLGISETVREHNDEIGNSFDAVVADGAPGCELTILSCQGAVAAMKAAVAAARN